MLTFNSKIKCLQHVRKWCLEYLDNVIENCTPEALFYKISQIIKL